MGLFTDIEFDDDESIIGHHYDDEAKKEICDDYVKIYSDFYGQHMKCSLIYEIVDDQLACFAEMHSNSIMPDENKNNDKYDDFVLPFDKTDINLMVKFKSAYKIEYIRGKIITYNLSKNAEGADEELFLLRYANDLMNNHGCRIDEIIFTDEEEESAWTLDSFNITMCYNRREAVANTPPLSEDFCKQFPKLSFIVPNKPLTNSLSFDRCHFASEKAFIYACNRLHEMYPKMAMSFNVATTYFGGHALWEGDQYFNDAFLKVVSLFEYKEHIDDYILIDINKLNKCLEQMNESLYNKIITKISKIVKKSINEAWGDNFDRKGADPLVKSMLYEIGDPHVKYSCTMIGKSSKTETGSLISFTCKASKIPGIKTPCGFYVKRTFNENGSVSLNPADFNAKKLAIPYHDKTVDYIILAVVNKGYQGENAYTAYVFDKELILNVIYNFKQIKKLNKGKNILKDEYNNKLNITSKRISLSQQFLSNAIYSFDNVYYAKTRDVLNGSYYDF